MAELNRTAEPLADLWWVRLPLAVRPVSTQLTRWLLDGFYLVAWPRVAGLLPPAVLAAGFLTGWLTPGFRSVFTESLTLMLLIALLGILGGANLGAMFVAGFAAGSFIVSGPAVPVFGGLTLVVKARAALLIEYALMAWLAVNIPMMAKALLGSITPPESLPRPIRLALAAVGYGALVYTLVYFWTQAVPILIRPVFTWAGAIPTVPAMQPLQERGMVLVWVAALAAVGRILLQGYTASHAALKEQLDMREEQLLLAPVHKPLFGGMHPWVGVLLQAAWTTFMLAGLFVNRVDPVLLCAVVVVIQGARAKLIRIPLGGWPAVVGRVPVLVRFAVGLIAIRLLAGLALTRNVMGTASFRPVVLLTIAAIIILYLLIPPPERREPA